MPKSIVRWICAVALAVAAGSAFAEPVSAGDAKAVRAVIEAQLQAFAADDARRAFSYAAPSIRDQFGTAERFMEMVKGGYPVVYRPAEVVFLQPQWTEGTLVQGVQMTDGDGVLWLAVYNVARQPDRAWRITGCIVQRQSGRMT